MANIYDQLIRAQLQNSSSDLTPTSTGLVYLNTTSHEAKVFANGAWKTLVDKDTAQVLTNKDIDGGTASNTSRLTLPKGAKSSLDALTRKQGTIVFDTTSNKPYFDDGSALQAIGSGSGGGSINYIANPDAETDVSGYIVYKDASQATPVDGTGGTGAVTFTRSTSAPLRGAASFSYAKGAADLRGEGVSYAFTIASADVSKTLQISFDVDATDTNYAAGDLAAYVYDVTNGVLITPAAVSIAQAKYQFQTTFVASTSTSYRLILHVATVNPAAYTVKFDNIVVGPQLLTLGTPVTNWQSYPLSVTASTTAPTFGTVTNNAARWRIVGGSLELDWNFAQSTAGTTGTGLYYFSLPSGYTVDSSVATIDSAGTVASCLGNAWMNRAGGPLDAAGIVVALTSTQLGVIIDGSSDPIGSTTQGAFNAALQMKFRAMVPVAQLAGSGVYLSTAQPEYAWNSAAWGDSSDSSSFAYGPNGVAFAAVDLTTQRSRRVRFLTPIQSTDKIEIEALVNGQWVPILGANLPSYPFESFRFANGATGPNTLGVGWQPVSGSSTDIDVYFGRYFASYSGDSVLIGWSAAITGQTTRWRVKKIPGSVQVATPVLPAPTAMSDVFATQQGHKEYLHGVTYNGGIAPTVTGQAGFTNAKSVFIPYQMQSGAWRLKFSINFTQSSSTVADLAVNGVTWLFSSAVGVSALNQAAQSYVGRVQSSTGNIILRCSAAETAWHCFGDVELSAKPTWAY